MEDQVKGLVLDIAQLSCLAGLWKLALSPNGTGKGYTGHLHICRY